MLNEEDDTKANSEDMYVLSKDKPVWLLYRTDFCCNYKKKINVANYLTTTMQLENRCICNDTLKSIKASF